MDSLSMRNQIDPILSAYIMPHPPIIIPGIGQGRENAARNTIENCNRIASEIVADRPDTIILSTPHAPGFSDFIMLSDPQILTGNFSAFGHPEISLDFLNDHVLASEIIKIAGQEDIPAGFLTKSDEIRYHLSSQLDHGALVPLYFIDRELREKGQSCKLVILSTPFLPMEVLYKFGRCIQNVVAASDKKVVYVGSGDLSHRLTPDAPAGYHPDAGTFDRILVEQIQSGKSAEILKYTDEMLDRAGQCGTRSFVILFGALDGFMTHTDVYSYEGPFGVGYLTARISVRDSEYVRLAKASLEEYIRTNQILCVPDWIRPHFKQNRSGVFVSIKKNGNLRGCIGTIDPVRSNLAEEIIYNAISAGTADPRFDPITLTEMDQLEISVDVLKQAEKIESLDELDPQYFGVIVSNGFRRGLLLPNLEGIDTPQEQVGIALQKAGLSSYEKYDMERFEVIRYF